MNTAYPAIKHFIRHARPIMLLLPLKNSDFRPFGPILAARRAIVDLLRPSPTAELAGNIQRLPLAPKPSETGARLQAGEDVEPVTHPADLQALINCHTRETTLADGTPIRLRPILPQDKPQLQSALSRMSGDSRYRRFMATLSSLSAERLRYLTEIDYVNHFALAALALDQHPPLGIGVARYVRDPDKPHVAEPAVTVVDDYQGRGLGSLLLDEIMRDALDSGITHFRATLFADNTPMKQVFAQRGAEFTHEGFGILSAEFALPETHQPRMDLVYDIARHAYKGAVMRARHALPYPLNY